MLPGSIGYHIGKMLDKTNNVYPFVNIVMAPFESPFPLRLKQARLMRQLSLRDLSDQLQHAVSHVALANYEKGATKPNGEVLGKLCTVLNVTPDFMFRPTLVTLDTVRFRKRKAFGAKQTAALLEVVRAKLEDYLEAEELVGEVSRFKNPLAFPHEKPTLENIRGLARELRELWGLGDEPIPTLVELLEQRGIRVIEVDEQSHQFDGCQIDGFAAIAVGLGFERPVTRKRFTIAHELAHVLLNDWVSKHQLSDREFDKTMDKFASEFLLPEAALRSYFGGTRTSITEQELVAVKLRFGVSIRAIVYALHEFQLIGDNAYQRFFSQTVKHWSKNGGLHEEPGDDLLPRLDQEHPQRFRRITLRGVSEGNISMSRGAGLLGTSLSEIRREATPMVE